ncbi:MAG: (Fe-S)-binding protein [Pseudomonadota bacterium]|nr:(Fe-S)-binding protein [Pseudomonadota bacterium]
MNEQALKKRLRETADQCVKCGLCLPACPTYRARRDEGESPRGRISLIQGWAEGRLERSARLDAHLASCLECRACERACPSLVAFGALMDDARALGTKHAPLWRRLAKETWLAALSSRFGTRLAAMLATFYRAVGLGVLVERAGVTRWSRPWAYHRLALQLRQPPRLRGCSRPSPDDGIAVGLFLGCVGQSAQPNALAATHRILGRLGFDVDIPSGQGCCGAMHRHNGLPEHADRLLAENAAVFSNRQVIGIASACVCELRTHPRMARTQEICRFLADLGWPAHLAPRALRKRVAVHEPCSQRNALRDARAAYELLRRIPAIEIVPLPDNALCCGAAGTYPLQQPEMSRTLLQPKIQRLKELRPDILVTTNTGCALHLAAGAREAGLDLEVLHPAELLARQLGA